MQLCCHCKLSSCTVYDSFHFTFSVFLLQREVIMILSFQTLKNDHIHQCPYIHVQTLPSLPWNHLVSLVYCELRCGASCPDLCIWAVFGSPLSLLARPWLLPQSHTWPTDWPQLGGCGRNRHSGRLPGDSADNVDMYNGRVQKQLLQLLSCLRETDLVIWLQTPPL